MAITKQFVSFITDTFFDDLPGEVVQRAKELFLDTLGVTVAGVGTPSAEGVREYVSLEGGGQLATVLGTELRTTPSLAALANGTSAHAWDYDDTAMGMLTHASGSLVNALLAMGEPRECSGREFLEAYVVGFEALYRMSVGIHPDDYLQGFHPTGLLGTIGSTACCAKLLKLSPSQTACAIGIACSMTSGLRCNHGTYTKALHAGLAARNAVTAVSLAAAGFTAHQEVLDDIYPGIGGFCSAYIGGQKPRFDEIERALAATGGFRLMDPGVGIKLSPTGTMTLAVIPCVMRLVKEHDIQPDQVEVIDYACTVLQEVIAPFDDPKTPAEAMYSLTHSVAAPIVYRKAGIREFSEGAVSDPQMADMRRRVHHFVDPELDALTATDIWDVPACRVTIRLKDGRSYSGSQRRPDAYPGGTPLSWDGLMEKFTECVTMHLPQERVNRCADLVKSLEDVENIGEVICTLAA